MKIAFKFANPEWWIKAQTDVAYEMWVYDLWHINRPNYDFRSFYHAYNEQARLRGDSDSDQERDSETTKDG